MRKIQTILLFLVTLAVWVVWPISGIFVCSPPDWNYASGKEYDIGVHQYFKYLTIWVLLIILYIWAPHFINWGLELY